MAVFAQPRIEPDVHRQGEIAHRLHAEGPPQVDRNRDLDRSGFPAGPAFRLLLFPDGFGHHRGQVGGHRHALFMGLLLQHVRRQDSRDDMAEHVRFRRAAQAVGGVLRPADRPFRAAGKEAVPGFLPLRCFADIHDVPFRRDLRPVFQGQVPRRQVLQQDQSARSVRHGMEDLHGDSVFIIQKAYAAGFQLPARHMRQRIGKVFLRLRRLCDRLQIVPEKAGSQSDKAGRKPGFQVRDRPVQHLGIHRLFQRHGNPEHVVPVFPDDRRKDQRGVIQPVPLFLHLFLRAYGNDNIQYVPKDDITMHPLSQTGRGGASVLCFF